jgi:hypothetical protein
MAYKPPSKEIIGNCFMAQIIPLEEAVFENLCDGLAE